MEHNYLDIYALQSINGTQSQLKQDKMNKNKNEEDIIGSEFNQFEQFETTFEF